MVTSITVPEPATALLLVCGLCMASLGALRTL
jgi:hypothetical protein